LKNANLRKIWSASAEEEEEIEIWAKLAQFGIRGIFDDNKTFKELIILMLKIKEREDKNKSMKGIRYSEHLFYFFSLLSQSSREYQIVQSELCGISLQAIR
jgi:hypothetical protein